jgi:AraC family transcriptional regulator
MRPQMDGARAYPTSVLLASSAGLQWPTLSAELRSHGICKTPMTAAQHTEVCLALAGTTKGLVRRTGAGQCQEVIPTSGAIWLTPIGVSDREITITAPIPKTMHLYLPTTLFQRLSDDLNTPRAPAQSIQYKAGIRDEVIHQIALSLASEITNESAAGRMYIEAASLTLAARLLHKYCDSGACTQTVPSSHPLDQSRLRRVLDYISANIEHDITLADLAHTACLSSFHFARKFNLATGVPPHRYLSRIRLERAMAELAASKLSIAEIALNAHFSSQASFTRAFHRAIGMTPKEYQRRRI